MRVVSASVFVLLTVIAAIHVYWGLGGLWPGTDVRTLIDTVVGDPRLDVMPSREITFAVAGLIFASGVFALLAHAPAAGLMRLFTKTAIAVIATVFIARGISGYALPNAIRSQMSEPFATFDRLYYSPLCLVLGAAFVALFFIKPHRQISETES